MEIDPCDSSLGTGADSITVLVPNREYVSFIDCKYNLSFMVTSSEFFGLKCRIQFKAVAICLRMPYNK